MTEPTSDSYRDEMRERLVRVETAINSLATAERLGRIEEKVDHIDRQMPQVARNAIAEARTEGWHNAKEDGEKDRRATWAVVVSALALLVAAYTAFVGGRG